MITNKRKVDLLTTREYVRKHGASYYSYLKAKKMFPHITVKDFVDNLEYYKILLRREKAMIKDHLGNEFNTFTEMCKHYKTSNSTVNSKLNDGMSLCQALEGWYFMDSAKNKYSSLTDFCNKTYLNYNTVRSYLIKNPTKCLQDILDDPKVLIEESRVIEDHLGNKFKTMYEMCKNYKVNQSTYNRRRCAGYTPEECLLGKLDYEDHLGNKFSSISKMCEYHGTSYDTYYQRLLYYPESTLEELLDPTKWATELARGGNFKTDNGLIFKSLRKVSEHYNIPYNKLYYHYNRLKDFNKTLKRIGVE